MHEKKWRFAPLLALVALASGCINEDEPSAADLTFPVSVEKLKPGPIAETITTTGTLKPMVEEQVICEVAGVLKLGTANGVRVASGSRVRAGFPLAEIENREYLLTIRVESHKLAKENAARELEKQEALFKEGGVTEKELEMARRTALDAAFNLEDAVLKAEKLRLKAPISGNLTNVRQEFAGTRVPAGFVFCTVMNYERVQAKVNLPNSDLGRVRIGQVVQVENYAMPGVTFAGEVQTIDPTLDAQTRTFAVGIVLDNRDRRLRPGMFVRADIVVNSRDSSMIVPKTALLTRNNRPVIFVVDEATAQERSVTTGIETRDMIEILDGVRSGEQIVVKGHETLRDNSKVRVTRE